jgi:hypothetical protein
MKAQVVPWLGQLIASLSQQRPIFEPGSVHVGIVVDKVALGEVFLRVPLISPSTLFDHISPYSCIILGVNNRPVGGCNSETYSHSNNTNNNN